MEGASELNICMAVSAARDRNVPIRVCVHRHAHRRCLRAQQPRRIEERPSASRRGGAPPGAESGAYRGQRGDRRGVPRADVHVEHQRLVERLRAEPHAVRADGEGSHVFGADTWAPRPTPTRARAHTDAHVGASVAHARIGDPFLYVDIRMDIDISIDHVYRNYRCVCSMDGLVKTAQSRIVTTHTRSHVYASMTQQTYSLTI